MPGVLSLIVNPAAGGGRSLRILPEATGELDVLGMSYQVTRSVSLKHAGELAAAAAGEGKVVVAVGGDGMVGALAGVTAAGSATLGIIPAGRGNDLASVLDIPASPRAAARVLAGGQLRRIDLISASAPGHPECVVAGSIYVGVPSVAGQIANTTRWLRGPAVYPLAALRTLATWRPVGFRLDAGHAQHDFPGYAVVVANSAFLGAGMMVAPGARIDDGVLDVVLMRHGPRLAFIRVLLKIRDGSHVSLAQVSLDRSAAVTLTMDRAMPVAADGETLPWACPLPAGTPLTVRALPAALTVLAPPVG